MSSNFPKTPGLLAVAVSAGVVIGAAGVFIYEHFVKEKRRLVLQQDVMTLGVSVSELRREVEELRQAQLARRRNRRSRIEELNSTVASLSESEADMMSLVDDDDEFFDFSDGEDYSIESQSNAELDSERLSNELTPEESLSHVSVILEEAVTRASHCNDKFTVVSRGEWHDDMHDKRFREIDKEISDVNVNTKEQAYKQLLELNKNCPNDAEILWRLAKVCHGIATLKGLLDDQPGKKQCVDEAVEYATRALQLAPRSAEVHKWYAISIGSRSEFQPVKLRIKDGFIFKDHIEEALKITPDDPTLLHLLGRFKFEVATLGWMERKIATSIFGEVPYATFPEALEPLLRVEILNKTPWKENRLIVAKCYIQMGENSKALEWLDNAYEVPCQSLDDERVHVEVQQLLEKYDKYRMKEKKKK